MDYILFIHGVNTRERREVPTYAKRLCHLIETYNRNSDQPLTLKMIPLYWGEVMKGPENNLLEAYQKSTHWQELSFKNIREKQLLQFTGDAALYISRYVSTRVVDALLEGARNPETGIGPGPYNQDRLHLVTHSWGTVIFFDILFSERWDSKDVGSYQGVKQIRSAIFGLDPSPKEGLRLCSIHTMGSPISIFSLITNTGKPLHPAPFTNHRIQTDVPSTHDITPGLLKWLKRLPHPIPWYNYLHPQDLIAYPLEKLIPQLLKDSDGTVEDKLMVEDIVTAPSTEFLDTVAALGVPGGFVQKLLIAIQFPGAHHSYWTNPEVARRILYTIRCTPDSRTANGHNSMLQGMKQLIRR